MIAVIIFYFVVLFAISRWAARRASNETFFRGNRQSPWYMVAFGMVGASISGITLVSVPGMVMTSQMAYLQLCIGFILGYVFIAFVLLPVYYRLNVASIYAYLGERLGPTAHLTGSWFFLLSKMTGAALRFYVVCLVLQQFVFGPMGWPFWLTAVALVLLIWLYTRRGGIRTLVFTDTFQTFCLLVALLLIIYMVIRGLGYSVGEAVSAVAADEHSRIFVLDDWRSPQNLWKQLVSGAFIVIVMTGLDQDMMQKNLTCKTLREAQKDMCSYGVAFVPVNLLFLALGVLLLQYFAQAGIAIPQKGDELMPLAVEHFGMWVGVPFVIGIVAASFSSADSALTSLTTIFCVDICRRQDDERLRKYVHLGMCVVFVGFILAFRILNNTSLIDAIYTLVGYTYGPLLGLFAFGLLTKRRPRGSWVPVVCVASPLLCYALSTIAKQQFDYQFGYELLLMNGLLTFIGCLAGSARPR